jgi:hypothetical protein
MVLNILAVDDNAKMIAHEVREGEMAVIAELIERLPLP